MSTPYLTNLRKRAILIVVNMTTASYGRVVALAVSYDGDFLSVVRHWCRLFVFITLCAAGVLWAGAAQAKHPRSVSLTIYNVDGVVQQTIALPLHNDTGGATVAVGDTDGDGVPEFIVGNGYGNKPEVRVFSQDGAEVRRFFAFDEGVDYGLNVAACDFDRDGKVEVVTALQAGGHPTVRVFHADGTPLVPYEFAAYDEGFRGGVSVACGDMDRDGVTEIVTAAGPTGGPHIRWWRVGTSFTLPTPSTPPSRAQPAVKSDDEDTDTEIIIGRNPDRPDDLAIRQWRVARGTVRIAAAAPVVSAWVIAREYFYGDASDTRGRTVIVVPSATGDQLVIEPFLRGIAHRRIEHTAYGDLNQDGLLERIVTPGNYWEGALDKPQEIIVDLSEQRLYAYENGLLKRSFFVSSGLAQFPTPTGSFAVTKVPSVWYAGNYGPNNPQNYDFGQVPNNLRFKPQYFLHTAYWHNDFGHRRSHGCVNIAKDNNDWLYGWATEGTTATIRD